MDWHKPPVVALLETKMQDHLPLLNDYPFNRIIEVPAVGNAGGLAVLWDDSLLELDDIATTDQEIHTLVKVRHKHDSWLFSCIYASTYRYKRRLLLENLKNIKNDYKGKWLIGGDFNKVLSNVEKKGGISYRSWGSRGYNVKIEGRTELRISWLKKAGRKNQQSFWKNGQFPLCLFVKPLQ